MRCGFRLIVFGIAVIALTTAATPSQAQSCFQWVRRDVAPDPAATTRLVYDTKGRQLIAVAGFDDDSSSCWTWRWNGATWDVLSITGPDKRLDFSIAYDSLRGVVVLFGGRDFSGASLGDTWEWDGSSWTQKPVIGPAARTNTTMCFDSSRGLVILFGGSGFQDTWTWDGATWVLKQASLPDYYPSYNITPQLAYDANRGVPVLVAKGLLSGFRMVTWEWSGTAWQLRSPLGPPNRDYFGLAFDPLRGAAVLHGGEDPGIGLFRDTWDWDGSTWTLIDANGPSRSRLSLVFDASSTRLCMYGGTVTLYGQLTFRSDFWVQTQAQWNKLCDGRPQGRSAHAITYDSIRDRCVIYGGSYVNFPTVVFGDTWEWDGAKWALRSESGPSNRYGMPMAFDSERGVSVLYGGIVAGSQPGNDTWEWNGDSWTQRSDTTPGPLYNNTMVFDPVSNRSIMYGGYGINDYSRATWLWNGAAWTLASTNGPTLFWNRATSFDSRRGVMVAFGGTGNFVTYSNQTWEWNNTSWGDRPTSNGPSARYRHASAFDKRRGVHMFFGGGQGTNYNNEVWEWDGYEWSQLMIGSSIPPRGLHSMSYDSIHRKLVVFGGVTTNANGQNTNGLGSLWELDLSATPTAITHPASPSICAGGSVTLKSTFDGPGPFTFRWRKDGQWLTDDTHRIGTDSDTLVFISTDDTDTGTYECRAVNACAQAFCKPATLTVFPTNTADGNLDGLVDGRDIAIFVNSIVNFAPVSAPLCAFDLTGEGVVSEADISPFVARLLIE